MRSSKLIHVVSANAAGEVCDVIVGGVSPPPSSTLWEMRTQIEQDGTLRNFVLNEPRGGVLRHNDGTLGSQDILHFSNKFAFFRSFQFVSPVCLPDISVPTHKSAQGAVRFRYHRSNEHWQQWNPAPSQTYCF